MLASLDCAYLTRWLCLLPKPNKKVNTQRTQPFPFSILVRLKFLPISLVGHAWDIYNEICLRTSFKSHFCLKVLHITQVTCLSPPQAILDFFLLFRSPKRIYEKIHEMMVWFFLLLTLFFHLACQKLFLPLGPKSEHKMKQSQCVPPCWSPWQLFSFCQVGDW